MPCLFLNRLTQVFTPSSFQKIARWHLKVWTFWKLIWLFRKFDQNRKIFQHKHETFAEIKFSFQIVAANLVWLVWQQHEFLSGFSETQVTLWHYDVVLIDTKEHQPIFKEQNNWDWRHKNLTLRVGSHLLLGKCISLALPAKLKPKQATALMGSRVHNFDLWYPVTGMH